MNYIKINKCDVANGTGVRVVLWVAGCHHHCKGCHNSVTWDFNSGEVFSSDAYQELINALANPWVNGITFSGGDPLAPENAPTILAVCRSIRERFGITKDIWIYTGYKYDQLCGLQKSVVDKYTDILVDGRYVEELRNISLKFRGSSNQRIINIKETLKKNKIITEYQGE